MSNPECSLVVHLEDAQARIPGPASEHSVSVLQRGSLTQSLRSSLELCWHDIVDSHKDARERIPFSDCLLQPCP
jgi:hypothetical protein